MEVFGDKIFHKSNFKAPLLQPSAFRWKSLVIAFCITSHSIFGAFHHDLVVFLSVLSYALLQSIALLFEISYVFVSCIMDDLLISLIDDPFARDLPF